MDVHLPRLSRYIPHTPTLPQQAFLAFDGTVYEAFFGGAAGGGKSDALLMAALQYADVPGWRALLLRRTYRDLALPGALMSRSHEWLSATDAHWNGTEKTWTFPSGATLTFGYLQHEQDKYTYQGAEFLFIGFDELTQFLETQYRYLMSRLRRIAGFPILPRMRAAGNPGGIGHNWVKARFITNRTPGRAFVPARLSDNPHLDQRSYIDFLNALDPVTRKQLMHGDWDVRPEGNLFSSSGFRNVHRNYRPWVVMRVRAWDLAATPGGGDWTVGARFALLKDYSTVVQEHVVRGQWGPADRDRVMRATARMDARSGTFTTQLVEQQPGEAGLMEKKHIEALLAAYPLEFVRPTGDKFTRAIPYRSAVDRGRIELIEGRWNQDWIDEHVGWQGSLTDETDDQVDAGSMAYNFLFPEGERPTATVSEDAYRNALAIAQSKYIRGSAGHRRNRLLR